MAISTLAGRVLFLSAEPRLIERQLAGENLTLSTAHELRDDVSTDEITPMSVLTQYDERLGRYPYVGLRVGTKCPIGVDDIKSNGFCVTVAGNRYGKGSSREHSPVAELNAGIHLVIAKSFERIYRQNADNLGLFTSTDLVWSSASSAASRSTSTNWLHRATRWQPRSCVVAGCCGTARRTCVMSRSQVLARGWMPCHARSPKRQVANDGEQMRYDDALPNGFHIIALDADPEQHLDAVSQAALARIGAQTVGITADADKTVRGRVLFDVSGKYQQFFDEHGVKAILVRPDYYVFGAVKTLSALSGLVANLSTRLSLFNLPSGEKPMTKVIAA